MTCLSGLNETAICKEGGAKGKWVTLITCNRFCQWGAIDGLISEVCFCGEFVADKVTSFFKQHAPKPQNRKGEVFHPAFI